MEPTILVPAIGPALPARRAGDEAAPARPSLQRVGLLGAGLCVPQRILTNAQLEQMVDTSDAWIVERTGMRERRIAAKGQTTSELAAGAAQAALQQAGLHADDVELVLVATSTPDTPVPATACRVQHRIGARKAAAFDVASGCTGFVSALMTGARLVAAGGFANAVVIGADVLSSITDYQDRDTCVLFGDGAGAVVLRAGAGGGEVLDHVLHADGSGADVIEVPAGGSAAPAGTDTVARRGHFLRMRGREVFRFAVARMCEVVEELAGRNGLTPRDIDWIVPHQANLRILEAAARKLGLPMDRLILNVDRYGNTAAASIPIALGEAAAEQRFQPGQRICTVAFGAGLSWGGSLLSW